MLDFDLKIHSRDLKTLIKAIKEKNPNADIDLVKKAYSYAEIAHKDQKRLSGEPFIVHPLEVAIILANLKLDLTTIVAALLHDVVEDTGITLEIIKNEFSEDIALLVDGVTKISSIKSKSKATAQAETLRKMLIATINDVRVIIIKLADKLHNMRTIMFQPDEKKDRIAKETLDIYAPLARRLGMSKISSELEDLAFHVIFPDEYKSINKKVSQKKDEIEEYINAVSSILLDKLQDLEIAAKITGRAKHYYSIYRKMVSQDKTFNDIYDIRAIRIITKEVKDCYGALGIIHTLWSPVASRFKDYIAVPKSNMYQSLHTTVIGPQGYPLEVQIKTEKMHETAEIGIAAHWIYKESKNKQRNIKNLVLLKNINKWQSEMQDTREFMKSLKMDLYEDEIFVFTPKGKIIKLAKGATPVDFAYAIHTEIGNHTSGARINNKIVPLRTKLQSGDIIEVLTTKKGHPSEAWLKFVVSSNARYKIRNWIRKNNLAMKQDIEEKERTKTKLKEKKEKKPREEKTATVSIPHEEHVKLKKASSKNKIGITLQGKSNVLIKLSQCCQPIPGDDVIGFITRGRGITVHKKECPSLKRLQDESERFINIVWEDSGNTLYPIKLAVYALDRKNLLKDIIDEISLCKTNIIKAEAQISKSKNELASFRFILEVESNDHLNDIIKKIKNIKNVTDVYKLNEKVILK